MVALGLPETRVSTPTRNSPDRAIRFKGMVARALTTSAGNVTAVELICCGIEVSRRSPQTRVLDESGCAKYKSANTFCTGDADAAADCSNPAITRASSCAHAGHPMAAKLSTAMHLVILPLLNARRCAGGATQFAKCAIYK